MGSEVKAYAGIGSRSTPPAILDEMRRQGQTWAGHFILRSGCAVGADSAFDAGAVEFGGAVERYLPWRGFNGVTDASRGLLAPTPRAYDIACRHHPGWSQLSKAARALHARNVHQVLGAACDDPAAWVLCWTPDGTERETTAKTGGWRQRLEALL